LIQQRCPLKQKASSDHRFKLALRELVHFQQQGTTPVLKLYPSAVELRLMVER